MSDKDAVLAANAAFYAAINAADVEGMARVWAGDDDVSCIHPGWPVIVGHVAVLGSWRDILESRARPRITCLEPFALVSGTCARVLCIELIDGSPLAASNHFKLIDGAWRLVHHQASPIVAVGQDEPPPNQIH